MWPGTGRLWGGDWAQALRSVLQAPLPSQGTGDPVLGDTREGVVCSLPLVSSCQNCEGAFELPEAGGCLPDPTLFACPPQLFSVSKTERVYEARLVVRECKTVSREYSKERSEGQGGQAAASSNWEAVMGRRKHTVPCHLRG